MNMRLIGLPEPYVATRVSAEGVFVYFPLNTQKHLLQLFRFPMPQRMSNM